MFVYVERLCKKVSSVPHTLYSTSSHTYTLTHTCTHIPSVMLLGSRSDCGSFWESWCHHDQVYPDHHWEGGTGKLTPVLWEELRCVLHGTHACYAQYPTEKDRQRPSTFVCSSVWQREIPHDIEWALQQVGQLVSGWLEHAVITYCVIPIWHPFHKDRNDR